MPQRPKGPRVSDRVYPQDKSNPDGSWRFVVFGRFIIRGRETKRRSVVHPSKAIAERERLLMVADLEGALKRTVWDAVKFFLQDRRRRGCMATTVDEYEYKLGLIFPRGAVDLGNGTAWKGADVTPLTVLDRPLFLALYRRMVDVGLSVALHRKALGNARSMLKVCKREGWITPAATADLFEVEGEGKTRKRKFQLRKDGMRLWLRCAFRRARAEGDDWKTRSRREGAIAALIAFYQTPRAAAIMAIRVGDIDNGGTELITPWLKTDNSEGRMDLAKPLRPLIAKLARGRSAEEFLITTARDPKAVCRHAESICNEAGIAKITAHGLRGAHASLATKRGDSVQTIVDTLGDGSEAVVREHYIDPAAAAEGRMHQLEELFADVVNEDVDVTPIVRTRSIRKQPRRAPTQPARAGESFPGLSPQDLGDDKKGATG